MKLVTKLPDTLVIVLSIMALVVGLTWIIPAGNFERQTKTIVKENGQTRDITVVVPNSYKETESSPQDHFAFLQGPIKGFISAGQIVAFVFIVGGAFGVLNKTNAINAGLQSIVQYSKKVPALKMLIIPSIIVLFSLAGATFGMSEEVLVFILITIPLALELGFDSITGVAIPFIGAGAGFAGAFANPFTIGIAQGIADIPVFSGWEYRMGIWLVFTLAATVFIMLYARKVERNPQLSLVYEIDRQRVSFKEGASQLELTISRKLILIVFAVGIGLLIYGVNQWGWYINEIAGLFVGIAIAAAIIERLSLEDATDGFKHGAQEMMTAGLVIAFSKGILIIAEDGKIIDTILYYVSNLVEDIPKYISVQIMFLVQSFLNFFLPSGSGQAALTMPIMAPLSDLLGITRQTAVLAFQFGDGLSNMIIPTSGVTMGVLSIAKIPYEKWVKWLLPLMGIFFILAILMLVPPVVFFDWQ